MSHIGYHSPILEYNKYMSHIGYHSPILEYNKYMSHRGYHNHTLESIFIYFKYRNPYTSLGSLLELLVDYGDGLVDTSIKKHRSLGLIGYVGSLKIGRSGSVILWGLSH